MMSILSLQFVAFSCLISSVYSLELRLYPSDFKHFSQSELRWPKDNSLQLTCELDGKDSDYYTLVWYLPHSQSRSTNISLQNGKSTLWMDGINSDDNGPYKCKAEKKLGLNIDNLPRIKDKTLTLIVSTSDSEGCQTGFFQCGSKQHHCIGQRYLCDGFNDCPDGSDETVLQCGEEDWCDGKLRCGEEARCLDPALCCDPQRDPSCERLLECCEPYIQANRFFFQLGVDSVEQSTKSHRDVGRGHIVVMIGGIIAFTCVLFVVIILMCQFPTEKPWLRPPNFLSRGRWQRTNPPHNLPVTMEDLDVYFESLRNVSCSHDPLPLPPMPPPYVMASEPPPPYPDSPRSIHEDREIIQENNNEDNNNGDINGNSDLRDQHTERIVAVLRPISPAIASRRLLRGGRSLVTLNPGQQGPSTSQPQTTMRESRSYAALVSPTHLQRMMLRDSSTSDSD